MLSTDHPHATLFERIYSPTLTGQKPALLDDAITEPFVVSQVMTASRNGEDLEMRVAGFWRFSGPGQLAEHWEAVTDEATWDAFWNTPPGER